jgi:ketosteroid isomerase-like protein
MSTHRRLLSLRFLLVIGLPSLAIAAAATLVTRPARGANRPGCSHSLKHRSAQQTISEHLALLQAGRIDEAMCDYAEDAVVVLPGQTVRGLNDIRAGLSGIGALLGGAVPQIQTLTATENVVLLTFSAFGVPCTIPDGSDTYVVEKGRIVTQTVHDTFHSAPGFVCPLAPPGT